jgi:hypothetical protein
MITKVTKLGVFIPYPGNKKFVTLNILFPALSIYTRRIVTFVTAHLPDGVSDLVLPPPADSRLLPQPSTPARPKMSGLISLFSRRFPAGVLIPQGITSGGYPTGTPPTPGEKPCDSPQETTRTHAGAAISRRSSAPRFRFCTAPVAPGTVLPSEVWS